MQERDLGRKEDSGDICDEVLCKAMFSGVDETMKAPFDFSRT